MTTMDEVIKGILGREGDTLGTNYLKYLTAANDVYIDLNLHAMRMTKREWLHVDNRTKSIKKPDGCLLACSISVIDHCGNLVPLIVNTNLKSDIVDISQDKDCHCECGCSSELCGNIKNYELMTEVISAKKPDGTTYPFVATTRKKINRDGSLVIERVFPQAKYVNGVWTETSLVTDEEFLCKLEMEECGCVKQTPQNIEAVHACCGERFYDECGRTFHHCCETHDPTFNVSEGGDRIIFPSGFMYEKVLFRFFYDAPTPKLLVPVVARRAIMYGIKEDLEVFDRKPSMQKANMFSSKYTIEKTRMQKLFTRYSLKEFYDKVVGRNIRMPQH